MSNKDELIFSLIKRFFDVVAKTNEFDKIPKKYGTDELFYKSEINMLELIGAKEKTYVTDLAKILHVTKGAVSQTISKLEKKNVIKKEYDTSNKSRILISLNEKGLKAHRDHLKWHEKVDKGYRDMLFSIDEDKLVFLNDFLIKLQDFLNIDDLE